MQVVSVLLVPLLFLASIADAAPAMAMADPGDGPVEGAAAAKPARQRLLRSRPDPSAGATGPGWGAAGGQLQKPPAPGPPELEEKGSVDATVKPKWIDEIRKLNVTENLTCGLRKKGRKRRCGMVELGSTRGAKVDTWMPNRCHQTGCQCLPTREVERVDMNAMKRNDNPSTYKKYRIYECV